MIACQQTLFINQFKLRTTSVSGAFNIFFTIVYSILTDSKLMQAIRLIQSAPDCLNFGYQFGIIITEGFNFTAMKEVLYDYIKEYDDPEKFHKDNKFKDDDTTPVTPDPEPTPAPGP